MQCSTFFVIFAALFCSSKTGKMRTWLVVLWNDTFDVDIHAIDADAENSVLLK
jgi:hypothetical protein